MDNDKGSAERPERHLLLVAILLIALSLPVAFADDLLFSVPSVPVGSEGIMWPPDECTSDGNGNWVTAWCENLDGDRDVYYSHSANDGANWSTPQLLDTSGATDVGDDRYVRIAQSGGTWVAVWDSTDVPAGTNDNWSEKDILFARSSDGGATWTAPSALNGDAANDYYKNKDYVIDSNPCIATGGTGKWIVLWLRTEMTPAWMYYSFCVASSFDDGETWTDEAVYAREWAPTSLLKLSYGSGQWIWAVCPSSGVNYATEVSIYRSPDGIHWVQREVLHTGPEFGSTYEPGLWTDGLGAWIIQWGEYYVDHNTPRRILACRSTNNGESWSTASELLCPPDPTRDQLALDMDNDNQGNLIAVVSENHGLSDTLGEDYDVLAYLSTDKGATWASPVLVNQYGDEDEGTDDGHTFIKSAGNGEWVALWGSWQGDAVQLMRATAKFPQASVSVTPRFGLVTSEGHDAASFTVTLSEAPLEGETVTAEVTSRDPSEGVVTPESQLTFTKADYAVPEAHTVTVIGEDDTLTDGDIVYAIAIGPLESDAEGSAYDGLEVPDVLVVNTDDEGPMGASIDGFRYILTGGPNNDRNLWILVKAIDQLGAALFGADITVDILRDGAVIKTDTQPTDGAGEAAFEVAKARSGIYTVVVKDVVKEGYVWDEETPENAYEK